jgi:hypothetical protein
MSDDEQKYLKWKYASIILAIMAVILMATIFIINQDLNLQHANHEILNDKYYTINIKYNELNFKYNDMNNKYTNLVSDNIILNNNYNSLKTSDETLQNTLNYVNGQLSSAQQVSQSTNNENTRLNELLTQYEKVQN